MDRRIPSLDGLRTIAISLVLLTHLWTYPEGHILLNRLAASGWVGVDLFFVLSGYLITSILVRARGNPNYFSSFYFRRTLRIFPPYYALLCVVLLALPHLKPLPSAVMRDSWTYWLYISNFTLAGGWQLFLLDITWSLSVEEQFYLIWPAVVRWIDRLVPMCVGVIIACPITRSALWAQGVHWSWMHMMMPLRADAFAWGAILATRPQGLKALTWVLLPVGLLDLTGQYGRDSQIVATVGYSLTAMAATGVVAVTLDDRNWFAKALSWRPFRYVGQVSYGVYLYHPITLMAISLVIPRWGNGVLGALTRLAVVAAASIGVASVSYYLLEQPLMRLKDLFKNGCFPNSRTEKLTILKRPD